MSNQKHRGAVLDGYGEPRFSPSLDELIFFYSHCNLKPCLLKYAAKKAGIDGSRVQRFCSPPTTSDGYRWPRWVFLVEDKNPVVILLPRKGDKKRHGHTPNDRYPAIYGASSARSAERLVRRFMRGLEESFMEGKLTKRWYIKKKKQKRRRTK